MAWISGSSAGEEAMVPEDEEWGVREMMVKDPDEHVIRFGQSITD